MLVQTQPNAQSPFQKLNVDNSCQKTRKIRYFIFEVLPNFIVKVSIGRIFLRLLSKYFPRNHTMHTIFNRNTVTIRCSCLRYISSIISSHNRKILSPKQQSFGCNCRVKNECPLNGECQTPSVTYTADVVNDSNDNKKKFISDQLTPRLKKGTKITLEILNMRSTKTVQNEQSTSGS